MKPITRRRTRWSWLPFVGMIVVASTIGSRSAADDPDGHRVSDWVRLYGGDHLSGSLNEASPTDAFVWHHEAFADPFRFDLRHVIGAAFTSAKKDLDAAATPQTTVGDPFLVELHGDDRVFGQLVAIDSQTIALKTVELGEVAIKRSAIDRISAIRPRDMQPFVGPQGLADWSSEGDRADWQNTGGRLSTQKDDASIFHGGLLPERARIELELSWDRDPNFVLALGVDKKNVKESTGTAFRLEVWDGQLVLVREMDDRADLARLGSVSDLNRVLVARFDLDQKSGTVMCRINSTSSTVQLNFPAEQSDPVHDGIRLINLQGTVHLDSIEVSALPPNSEQGDRKVDRLSLKAGEDLRGKLQGIGEDNQWIFITDDAEQTERRIDPGNVADVYFAATADEQVSPTALPAEPQADPGSERSFRAITHSGSRLTGVWQGISEGRLRLSVDALAVPVALPLSQLSRLNASDGSSPPVDSNNSAGGRLELPGGELHGKLVVTPADNRPTPIRFQANGSSSVTLQRDFSGCFYYREPPAPETPLERHTREAREKQLQTRRARQAVQRQNKPGIMDMLGRAFLKGYEPPTEKHIAKSLQLKSGEKIPCEVTRIDKEGVVFTSELAEQTRLPHGILRAVHLVSPWEEPVLDPSHQQRLLTVPRVGKNRPPSHLVIAKNGDMLRCNLVRLTDVIAQVETRLETVEIDRTLIASIIWLDDPSEESPGSGDVNDDKKRLTVQASMKDGNRISLIPEAVTESAIVGKHPFLGKTQIDLNQANELAFGTYVNRSDRKDSYQQWQLQNAPEPIIAGSVDGDGERTPGLASKLVGESAPDFRLDFLDGEVFRVSEQTGKVLVLDFWATWCGPCIQAMPVIDQTVSKFDTDQVMLVSVNLQETADTIRKTLERIDLSPRVALDIDGVAAARYQVDAIPQTVVIDRKGVVRRVFVGSSGDLGEQLATAIEEQLSEAP